MQYQKKKAAPTKKRNIKKILLFGVSLLAVLVNIPLVINAYVKASAKPYILSAQDVNGLSADCALVLGAGVWEGGQPSHILEDRLKQGISLYENGVSNRLLMSGDHGRTEYDEVNVMKQYAIDQGVASSHIFMDHAGFSTYESMVRAKEIFEAQKIVIVTQEFHLYRAIYIARSLGLEAYGVASDLRPYGGQKYFELREMAARVKDFFYTILRPDPTYLGEAIPVSGDGNLTND
ncbi:YdcF family protein [Christensenellaceae bacterium OttesenSCG-928-M15]|nr:YdcF family protein [Christensenellaceae bacterium OttesenSCG-928-M15]